MAGRGRSGKGSILYEKLFRDDTIHSPLDFAGLRDAGTDAPYNAAGDVVDEFHAYGGFWTDPRAIVGHPEVVEVAAMFGYAPLAFDEESLRRRYGGA